MANSPDLRNKRDMGPGVSMARGTKKRVIERVLYLLHFLSSAIAATSPAAVLARLKWEGSKVSGHAPVSFLGSTVLLSPHQVLSHQISAGLEVLIELVPLQREGPCG